MLKFFGVILCAAIATAASVEVVDDDFEMPPGTISCQIDSPDRDECIKEAIQDMLPKLVNGSEALRIPKLDPFVVETYSVNFKRGKEFFVSVTTRDVHLYGASKAQMKDVKTKITRTHISTEMKVYIPQVMLEGLYRGEGRFNNLKIKSKGYFNLTATNIDVVTKTEGDISVINGKEYVKVTRFDATPNFGSLKVFATGLLPDSELNRIALEFVNQYWPFMYREMMPEVKAHMEPMLIERCNEFLLHVPIRKMLYYGEDAA